MYRLAILLLPCLLLLEGCGGGSNGPAVTGLTVFPDDFSARIGDVVALNAVASYASGPDENISREVSWQSTDPSVGTVSATGEFTARASGQTQVSASKAAITSNAITITVVAVPSLPTASYFPLGLGHQWDYTGSEVSPTGVQTSAETITARLSITRQEVLDGSVWYEVLVKGSDPLEAPGYRYMRHDPEGLVQLESSLGGTGYVVARLLDASLTAGATWPDPEDPQRTFTIESTTEHVEAPAGSYDNCVKVVEADTYVPPRECISWYKAGVGMVKWEQYDDEVLVFRQKLVSVQLGVP